MNREKFGKNLQTRARELGLADAEIARRLDLGQSRYANYVSGAREPDFATFAKICRVLGVTPNILLEFDSWPEHGSEEDTLVQRITAVANILNLASLRTAAAVLDALAASQDSHPIAQK